MDITLLFLVTDVSSVCSSLVLFCLNFVDFLYVAGFMPPLAKGWLLVHWAYGSGQRQKHKFDVEWNIYLLDLGMALEDSQILALKALQE